MSSPIVALRRLPYTQKFVLISLLFLLPLAVTLTFLVNAQNQERAFSQKEIDGARYLAVLNEVHADALQYRRQALRVNVRREDAALLTPLAATIDTQFEALTAIDGRYGDALSTRASFVALRDEWRVLSANPVLEKPHDLFVSHSAFIANIRSLISLVGDQSNLILDPDLDSYYVMDSVLLRLPQAQDLIARAQLVSEDVLPLADLRSDKRTELVMLTSLLRSNSAAIVNNLDVAYAHNPAQTLAGRINPERSAYLAAIDAQLTALDAIIGNRGQAFATPEFTTLGDASLAASRSFHLTLSPALTDLLQSRIDALNRNQTSTLTLVALTVTAALAIGLWMMRSISRPLNDLIQATSRLEAGDMSARVAVTSESEIGRAGLAFNRMAAEVQASRESLEFRVDERTRELNEAMRLAEDQRAVAEDARAQAEEATRAKSAFLANMSHELRTPLNAILGYSEMLQEEAQDLGHDDFIPDLEKIRTAGKHLLALINDILDLSKIEAGRMDLFNEAFSLRTMVSEIVTTATPLIEKNNNRFSVQIDEQLGTLYADQTKLRQCLLNLLSNAAKFTENGSIDVNIDTTAIGDQVHVRFEVRDSGIGMTTEQLNKLFKEFSQGDASTTRKYGGTGLGLALSRRFCQMMGGDITVSSVLGEGSIFTMYVPLLQEPDAAARDLVSRSSDLDTDRHTHATVLVIDDDLATREMLTRTLARENIRVVAVATGEEGIARAKELKPDVITLDVLLSGMDGWKVLTALKADAALERIPVVMLTIMEDRRTGYALGAADYLTKPVDRQKLLDMVQKHCEPLAHANQQPQNAILVVEDDPATRDMLQRTVEQAGFVSQGAGNGLIALQRIAQARPALILLDLMMPEMDGFTFLQELRAHPEHADIPVIVVTAMDLTLDDRKRLNSSVHNILQKGSYERESLLHQVRELVMTSLSEERESSRATGGSVTGDRVTG